MNNQLCTYYSTKSECCSQTICKTWNLNKDGTCKVHGEIYDKFKDKPVTNYEYKKNYRE